MLKFDFETWRQRPDLYPMVDSNRAVLKGSDTTLKHGDILVPRADKTWHAMPEDVYKKVRREFYV